jgi:arylformamidase
MLKTAALGLAGLIFGSTSLLAQQNAPRLSEPCRAEIMKLCGAKGTDKQARRTCMMENRTKISEGCRTELRARMEAHRAAKAADPAKPENPETK